MKDYAKLILQLEAESIELNKLADEATEKIKYVEEYLTEIGFEHTVYAPPALIDSYHSLGFELINGSWRITMAMIDDAEDEIFVLADVEKIVRIELVPYLNVLLEHAIKDTKEKTKKYCTTQ